jgi:hypothetical protein
VSLTEKSSAPKWCATATAHGCTGTELLPSFHSNKQTNALVSIPFLFETMSVALCERNQAPKKNRFSFFFTGWKVNISFIKPVVQEQSSLHVQSVLLEHAVNIPSTYLH